VSVYTSVKNRGGELKLANLTKKIKDLLSITQLLTIFDAYDSVDEALGSFK
jgi:anti-sigma B factor antagonist